MVSILKSTPKVIHFNSFDILLLFKNDILGALLKLEMTGEHTTGS